MSLSMRVVEAKPLLKALARCALGPRLLEGVRERLQRLCGGGREGYWSERTTAASVYGVWQKHHGLLHAAGMACAPAHVAEFGPGDSTGVGLTALLSGAQRYMGFDAGQFTDPVRDAGLVQPIAELLRQAAQVEQGWPPFDMAPVGPVPGAGASPCLAARVRALQQALAHAVVQRYEPADTRAVRVLAPWQPEMPRFQAEFDMVFSHSVLQYVDDLEQFFRACAALLRPGGWTSHQIDLSSMRMTRAWNGHLAYTQAQWSFITVRQRFYPRRHLLPHFVAAARNAGLEIVSVERLQTFSGLSRRQLAPDFREYPSEDLRCREAFLIARKRGQP